MSLLLFWFLCWAASVAIDGRWHGPAIEALSFLIAPLALVFCLIPIARKGVTYIHPARW